MVDVEQTFARLIGRQPSDKEIQSLYRVKSALEIEDNDALWLVLIALESYDTLYRKYPAMIGAQVEHSLEQWRTTVAAIADTETKKALGTLAEAVGRTSEGIAMRAAQASWMLWCGVAMLGLVLYGSFCLFIGFVLGSGKMPYWAAPAESPNFAALVIGTLARTPAGWIGAIAGVIMATASAWHAAHGDQSRFSRRMVACLSLVALSLAFLWPLM